MHRCSSISTKLANTNKKVLLNEFIDEYIHVVQLLIDILWELENIPKLITKEYTDQARDKTWLLTMAIQCAAKQASAIVRGTRKKNSQRWYRYNLLLEEGKTHQAEKLLTIIEKNRISKPVVDKDMPLELDSRLVDVSFDSNTSFDGWITIKWIGRKLKIRIPFKRTQHFNKLYSRGGLRPGLRLGRNQVWFNFETETPDKVNTGNTLGLDMGVKKVFVSSDGQLPKQDKDGWNLTRIMNRLKVRKKGSKNFRQTQVHRKNFVNWAINQLNLSGTKELHIENLKDMTRGVKCSRFLKHWCYPLIKGKLANRCEELGVQLTLIEPAYTSQRCSQCGWVQKTNRHGESFKCKHCGFTCDADLNASVNISLNLPILDRKRLAGANRKGFYWNTVDEAGAVPHYPKTSCSTEQKVTTILLS